MFERTSSSLSAWRSMRVTRGASFRRWRFARSMRRSSASYFFSAWSSARARKESLIPRASPRRTVHSWRAPRSSARIASRSSSSTQPHRAGALARGDALGAASLLRLAHRYLPAPACFTELLLASTRKLVTFSVSPRSDDAVVTRLPSGSYA
jgi:hypothetical protein